MNPHASDRPELGRRRFLTAAGIVAAGAAVTAATGPTAFAARPRTSSAAPLAAGAYRVPAEDVRHTRTWMAWPDSTAIWKTKLSGVQSNIALIARTVAKYEPVVMCANPASAAKARSMCGSAVTVIDTVPVDDCWMRDTGAVFRTNGAGGLDAVGLNFNGWGNRQTHAKDALVAQRIAAYVGVPFTAAAGIVAEGGAIEQDGAGTLMATRSSILNDNRNPGRTQAQLEAAMCTAYGASKVVWFAGIKGQDITDDHVDATSRFLAGGGLVQMPLASDTDAWAQDARQQYQILSTATNAAGNTVPVTKLQGPDYYKIRSTSADFVAAYANYYVCNGAVISAQFGDTAADSAARATLARLFPGRVVEQLNIDYLGAGGGGIHCVTQQQPAAS
ncbi:agmatine/peptidylarginine deiminase [Kitasatospora sp. NPDC088391]|uniref:agmatine deiminase family protein n=1 Tax=Kitasatospora sp. NPDC088391 TaxID=3364074 RepID=UPI00380718F7